MTSNIRILIISSHIDAHADAVRWALDAMGQMADFWDIADFPAISEASLWMNGEHTSLEFTSATASFAGSYDSIWIRRVESPTPRPDTHADDLRVVTQETEHYVANILPHLGHKNTLWVNHPLREHSANLKLNQLAVAWKAGFRVPPTYMGNSPASVRFFFNQHNGAVVFKAFRRGGWKNPDGSNTILRTARLNSEHVKQDFAIRACPGIYQALIPKDYEVRVTVFGQHIFAVKIDSQRDGETVDWRYDFRFGEEPILPIELPDEISRKCIDVCNIFSLTYAAFDFIVDKNGEYIFLELNPAGQFLFCEHRVPDLLLLDAFARFLMQAPHDSREGTGLHMADYFESKRYEELLRLQQNIKSCRKDN